jgi:ATP synthase protein I
VTEPVEKESPYGKEDPRLVALGDQLKAHPASDAAKPKAGYDALDETTRTGIAAVFGQLIGGPLGGGIIGYVIDRVAGTAPWGLIIMMFLGFAVAARNIYRLAQNASGN